MFEPIFNLPNSPAIFVVTILIAILAVLLIIGSLLNIFMFIGPSLSQWIERMRWKSDAESAATLKRVRKNLEILAHDVLKHRLLGLSSLAQQLKRGRKEGKQFSKEQLADMRDEMFRLCGVRSDPNDRLWKQWNETFQEIRRLAHHLMISPIVDPTLRQTSKIMFKLRAMFSMFISKDKANAFTPDEILKLDLESCEHVYDDILKLANGCQMIIEPKQIVERALDMLCRQTGRKDANARITTENIPDGQYTCVAASQTLCMCLVRLIDNALTLGGDVLVTTEISVNDLTGLQFLIFRIYDTSDKIPEQIQYGLGLRGVLREITEFDGGFRFKAEKRGDFQKCAVLSIPIDDKRDIPVQTLRPWRVPLFVCFNLLFWTVLVFATARTVGGVPVQFAGEGMNVIEFPVEAGHELVIPLCTGGSNVSAEINIDENASCWEGYCSLYSVLNDLAPCANSLNDPKCPGELRWTPKDEDGLRQGKSYEINIHCVSAGPPKSEDSKNIRLLVYRPNTAPKLVQLRVENLTTGEVRNFEPDAAFHTVESAIDDKFLLRALAVDPDGDAIQYTMHLPNGQTITSYDGVFTPEPDWENSELSINVTKHDSFAPLWRIGLETTDKIATPTRRVIQFRATRFRPLQLRQISITQSSKSEPQPCSSFNNTQFICMLGESPVSQVTMSVWIDPLAPKHIPKIELVASDGIQYAVKELPNTSEDNNTLRHWQIDSLATNKPYLTIEQIRNDTPSDDGLHQFVFNVKYTSELARIQHLPLELKIVDETNKVAPYQGFLLFTQSSQLVREPNYTPTEPLPTSDNDVNDEAPEAIVPSNAEAAII